MITIYYWPDGCWCYSNERQQFTHRSDDYGTVQVSLAVTDEQIGRLVAKILMIGE